MKQRSARVAALGLLLVLPAGCSRDALPSMATPLDAAVGPPDAACASCCPDTPQNPCPQDGLECVFALRVGCLCVFPERAWVCCGGPVQFCPDVRPVEGTLCSCRTGPLGANRCGYCGTECDCAAHRWRCGAMDLGAGCDGG